METTLTADVYQAQFENGVIDRILGAAIKTRDEHQAINPGYGYEDLQDLYRSYRNGYNKGSK